MPAGCEFVVFMCGKVSLTEAPTTVEVVEELISNKDNKKPDGPECDVGNGTQDPVATRTRHPKGIGISESRHSIVSRQSQ